MRDVDASPLAPVLDLIESHRVAGVAPVVVGLTGGVGVGKSTSAELIAEGLTDSRGRTVSVVSSDGFLHRNAELERRGLTLRKGFPESFDTDAIVGFLRTIAAGDAALAPVHDHHTYDIRDEPIEVQPGDVVVFEGVNALLFHEQMHVTIYVHADAEIMRGWFVERATVLRERARTEFSPFFDVWVDAPDDDFAAMLDQAWFLVNLPNLVEAIEPTRTFADVVITKGADHTIASVEFRDRSGGAR